MEQPTTVRARAKAPLRQRTIVLVGLMGAGKTSVGRRLAKALKLPFTDADQEVEKAAGQSIGDIFETLGEPEFRLRERQVIQRLLDGPPQVLATGGGAFMDAETRALIKERAVSVWLKADIDVLASRVSRKDTRPLLRGRDAAAVLRELAAVREPIYAQANLTVESAAGPHEHTVKAIIAALRAHTEKERS